MKRAEPSTTNIPQELVGEWEGRWQVREGQEQELTAAERKRFVKMAEVIPLSLRADGTFCHRVSCEGTWRLHQDEVRCQPTKIEGRSLEDMRKAAEAQDRVFGLAFLFDPFALYIAGQDLASANERHFLYVRYARVIKST